MNRPMVRHGACVAALLLLSACATGRDDDPRESGPAVTPVQQYKMHAEKAPDEILLGQHPDGLSDHQRSALADYARSYIEAGGELIVIRTPADGGEAVERMAQQARAVLQAAGLHEAEVAVGSYAADKPGAPVRLAYDRWRAKTIPCGRSWEKLTARADNQTQSNFGCAETANMASQVADPRDINGPRAMDRSDAGRRSVVLDKYRTGQVTAAQADEKMKALVSQEVQ
jgi:pilus assembly protein CpaD